MAACGHLVVKANGPGARFTDLEVDSPGSKTLTADADSQANETLTDLHQP